MSFLICNNGKLVICLNDDDMRKVCEHWLLNELNLNSLAFLFEQALCVTLQNYTCVHTVAAKWPLVAFE